MNSIKINSILFLNPNFNNSMVDKRNFTQTTNNISMVKNTQNNVAVMVHNPYNNNMKFYFYFYNFLYWPDKYAYTLSNVNFLKNKWKKYKQTAKILNYKSEFLLRFAKRNAQVIIHMPRVPVLVYKKHFLHREKARNWNKKNSSDMLFGFSAGRCGFKPNETKSFIANDTLVRAGLWFITRFAKKLSPIKLRFMGHTTIFRKYLYRLIPKHKKRWKYDICTIEESTPIPFNGCKLSHYPRKRFRYHANNFRKLVTYIKKFQVIKK